MMRLSASLMILAFAVAGGVPAAGQSAQPIGPEEAVEPVTVTSGQGLGAWTVIEGGLSTGDRVVTRGNERLIPGQRVAAELQEYALP